MKKPNYNFKGLCIFLCVCLLTVIGFSITYTIRAKAENNNQQNFPNFYLLKSFSPEHKTSPNVNVEKRTSLWLKLEPGKSPDTTFYGRDSAISALQSNLAEPTSQVSADINADGYNDLISGFRNAAGGGLIALHRASRQAFEPTDEKVLADLRQGVFPATFEKDALILDVPTAPDFIFAGKFTQDSAVDLVFASRGGRVIYLMTSDGNGGFNQPQEIAVGGEITALAAERLNIKTSAYFSVVAAVRGKKSSFITVFDGSAELGKTAPRNIEIQGDVTSLILASAYGGAMSRDVFGLADGEVFTIRGIDTPNIFIDKIELSFRSTSIAVGEFIADRQARAEIAVLTDNGSVAYLTHGTLDTRPFTAEEMEAFYATHERGVDSPVAPVTDGLVSDKWQISEERQLGVDAPGGDSSPVLQKARLTGNETEDLLVTDSADKTVKILFKEPNRDKNRTAFTGETKTQAVSFADTPAGVLPMRLNVTGQQGFVYFAKGSIEPIAIIAAPNATFTVTKTADTNDGACNADCSLREAVIAANNAAGADMISIPSGTFQLTRAGANENAASTGDLDVTQALTITGNGTANTIIQAGSSNTNGIDKVFSIDPTFNASFATTMSGMTIRYGRNPSTFSGDGYGGGLDWDAGSSGGNSGTLSLSNIVVDSNTATDGVGGGIALVGGTASSVTLNSVTVSNNLAQRVPVTGNQGGGIFVGANTPLSITNVVVSGNSLTNPNSVGGGIYILFSTAGASTFNNLTVTGNSVTGNGGGIYTTRGLTINAPTVISNNTATGSGTTGFGGGIYMNSTASVNLSKATMVGNSATTNGGAIALGSGTGAAGNTLNMSFSRIVNNTSGGFKGLVTSGGTANVENNWWGCNTGPSAAPCDTAGTSGGVLDFDPWLRFTHTANPTTIVVGQTSTLTVSFLTNSNNQAIAASNLDVFNGVQAIFNNAVRGTISGSPTTIQNGTATATFTGTSVGAGSADAKVDNGTATANITVAQAATTTTITSDNPDPSSVGQAVTVTYTVIVNSPGAGTPTGNVTVSDGVNSCTGTVAAGSCAITLNTPGARTLTATYTGDTNFAGSTSAGVSHTVQITADLAITKTDGVTTVTAGGSTTYTITASNTGPNTATGATVTDTFPAALTCTFTAAYAGGATGPASGSGNINAAVNLPSGGSATFTARCTISASATGTLSNTATVTAPAGVTDPTPGNNSATDSDTILVATAASVEVGGRVMTNKGRGISGGLITITDSSGNRRVRTTNVFGYFRFTDVSAGETYIISVKAKRYSFVPQVLNITDNLTDLNFIAEK